VQSPGLTARRSPPPPCRPRFIRLSSVSQSVCLHFVATCADLTSPHLPSSTSCPGHAAAALNSPRSWP
jgi:hypothetical protein